MNPRTARPIGFGVIGCGTIAYWTHLRILRHLPGTRLVAAADPDPQARARAAALARVPVHASAGELLARDDVDAVVVASPTGLLADHAVAACAAAKHVYVEKPGGTSVAELGRIAEVAAQAGVEVMVGFNRRFHPLHQQARALIAEGKLGRVHAIRCAFCEPVSPQGMPEWKRRRTTGGGVLLDLASHHLDLLRWYFGDEVTAVDARIASDANEQDTARLRLWMRGGAAVDGLFTFRAGPVDCLEFLGDRGTLRVDRHRSALDWRLPRRFGYGVRRGWLLPTPAAMTSRLYRIVRPSHEPSYRRALSAFVELIGGGTPAAARIHDGARVLEILSAAEESALGGRTIACGGDSSECASS